MGLILGWRWLQKWVGSSEMDLWKILKLKKRETEHRGKTNRASEPRAATSDSPGEGQKVAKMEQERRGPGITAKRLENVYLEVPNLSNSKPARRGRGTKKPSRGPRTSTAENQTQGGTWKPTSDQRVKRWCQRQEAATTTTKATVLELSVR